MSVFTNEVTSDQGAPNTAANSWPVEITDGTNILGTAAHPVKTDPTGATTQPVSGTVSVSNFPATQPVSGTVTANAGTGNFTVVQGTGTNLHVVVDSGTVSTTSAVSSTATITRVSTSTTAATALASNASRKSAIITSELGTTYIALGGTASATNYTYIMSATTTLEIPVVWTGSISAVRASGTGSIQVTELS